MKSLQIRETPPELYNALCEAAENEGRSLSQQALFFLAKGAKVSLSAKQRRKMLLQNFTPFEISKKFNGTKEISNDRRR